MIPVPDNLTNFDVAFGNIKHMPKYEDVPEEFKQWRNPYNDFVSRWFGMGRSKQDMERLIAKEGVDRGKAIVAIKVILMSFEPKHEHKCAGAAYLLSQWFTLKEGKDVRE